MSNKMQAAFVEQFGKPLALRECDIPYPGPGEILVKTEACGVCHTDLHAATGDWPLKPQLPFIPGHEAIGKVVALGSGVTSVKEGDRVGVPWLYSACGHCEYCLSAWETVCAKAEFGGYTRNGGFAEYLIADPDYVAHIPANLDARQAAPLICAGITTYKGIKETQTKAGDWIVISGAGGLGHLAIQYAKVMGLQVCAVDIDDGKLAHATRLGADAVVNAKEGDPAAAVKKVTDGGAHGVLITAPSLIAFKQGVGMTRKRGTCVLVGLPPGEFPTPLFGGQLHHDPRLVRGNPQGHGRSTRFRRRRQGQGRYRIAAACFDQPGLRKTPARRCAVARGSGLQDELKRTSVPSPLHGNAQSRYMEHEE
jgi:propanol-preferring alcohol dehydrogenase